MPGFRGTMHEWKSGRLHSGSKHGPLVTSYKQAIAIAMSQARKEHPYAVALRKHGKKGK